MNLRLLLAPYDLTVLDLISYLGLATCATMTAGLMLGMLLGSKYDPVVSWPHRQLPLFKIHNILGYLTLALALAHPAMLLLADGQGFGLLQILLPVVAPKQPFENALGALALYGTIVIVITSYFRKRMTFRRWKAIHYSNYLTVLTFIFHSLLTNPNLDDKQVDFTDGGKVFVLICVVAIIVAMTGRAFYAGRATRLGVTTAQAVRDSAARWEGRLRVARKFVETGAVQTFRLMTEDGGPLPFNWAPGQYVTLALQTPTGPMRRSYTIASSPNQSRFLELTIKREGGGSVFLHDHVNEGDFLDVKGPQGVFTFSGDEAERLVMIAGGVGVTPMMSKLRHLTESAWDHSITLIYGVQTLGDVIFKDELAALKKRHPNFNLHILPSDTGESRWTGYSGYLTIDKIATFAPQIALSRVHLCGPAPMMSAVLPLLQKLGVPDEAVFTEDFTSLPADQGPGSDDEVTITFQRSHRSVIAKRGEGIIRVAEANGVPVDYSCRTGECGSCRCKLISGEVDMPKGTALTEKERNSGLILACVARPVSNAITLDL
jgi:glycine betaine catabolism B